MEKMISIPEWRYNEMMETYEKAWKQLIELHTQLVVLHTLMQPSIELKREDYGKD